MPRQIQLSRQDHEHLCRGGTLGITTPIGSAALVLADPNPNKMLDDVEAFERDGEGATGIVRIVAGVTALAS